MRGFGENLADRGNESEFIGPNPPGGRRTKNRLGVSSRMNALYRKYVSLKYLAARK